MKKQLWMILMFVTTCSILTGCKSNDYKKAGNLFQEGQYKKALEIYKNLGDYKDSTDCYQEASYMYAEELRKAEEFDEAISIFTKLGEYKQSKTRLETCVCKKAKILIDEKKFDEAKILLEDYKDSDKAKNLISVCNIYKNKFKGLAEYIAEKKKNEGELDASNTHWSENYDYATPDGCSYKVSLRGDAKDNYMSTYISREDSSGIHYSLQLNLSGKEAGQYDFSTLYIKYDYYGNISSGVHTNGDGKINITKHKRSEKIKFEEYEEISSINLKSESEEWASEYIDVAYDAIQKYLDDQNLNLTLKDLGLENY